MKDNKHIQSFNEHQENLNSETLDKSSSISDVSDSSKSIAVDFAKWIADNKWYKQVRYDVWEKSGETTKSTSQLFDLFIENYH
jgi:hypothetical protein